MAASAYAYFDSAVENTDKPRYSVQEQQSRITIKLVSLNGYEYIEINNTVSSKTISTIGISKDINICERTDNITIKSVTSATEKSKTVLVSEDNINNRYDPVDC